jgi:hypothetical protein
MKLLGENYTLSSADIVPVGKTSEENLNVLKAKFSFARRRTATLGTSKNTISSILN